MDGPPSGDARERRSLEDLQAEHGTHLGSRRTPPRGELAEQSPVRNYVRDLVLGFNDGLVSVYAVTAGVAGAAFTAQQTLVAGLAAAAAGALSMAAGEYISTKSQAEFYAAERALEKEHLKRWPALEKEELVESLAAKGIREPLLSKVADTIASDPEQFLEYMMREEFGVGPESGRSPWRAAVLIVAAFLAGAALAVTPYAFLDGTAALAASSLLSLGGLFVAGLVRARASRLKPWRAGLEMVFVGLIAAAATYGLGAFVGQFV